MVMNINDEIFLTIAGRGEVPGCMAVPDAVDHPVVVFEVSDVLRKFLLWFGLVGL